jgi:hypothetical protein
MTGPRSAEDRIALWLEEESAGFLPDRVLDATFDRTRDTHQRGPSVWRLPSMTRPIPALIVVGAAAVIIVAAAALFARPTPNQSVGASPISAGPYTSPLFAYTVDVPAGWQVVPAIKPWPAGQRIETDSTSVDTFRIPGSPIDASMAVAAQAAPQGTTAASWLSTWERIREDIGGRCFGSSVGWMTATVVGLPAWHVKWRCDNPTDERSNWDEYTFLAGGMGYVISGNPVMVDRLLASFRLPSSAIAAPPSPIPTTCPAGDVGIEGCRLSVTDTFEEPFTLDVPPGATWRLVLVTDRQVHLQTEGGAVDVVVVDEISRNPCSPTSQDGPWSAWRPSSQDPAAELVSVIRSATPADVFGEPAPVIMGERAAISVGGFPATGDLSRCGGFITVTDTHSPGGAFGLIEGLRFYWYVVEVGGRTVIVSIAGEKPTQDLLQRATPAVDSIRFAAAS